MLTFLPLIVLCAGPTATVPVTAEVARPDVAVVMVTIDGCGPCKELWARMEKTKPSRAWGWVAWQVNVSSPENADFIQYYGIRGPFPELLLFHRDKLQARRTGAPSDAELARWVESYGRPVPLEAGGDMRDALRVLQAVRRAVSKIPVPKRKRDVDDYLKQTEPIALPIISQGMKDALPD